jgi:hypothetical protein
MRLETDANAGPATWWTHGTLRLTPRSDKGWIRRLLELSECRKTLLPLIAQLSPRRLELLIELLIERLSRMLVLRIRLLRRRILPLTELAPRRRRRLLLRLRLMTELPRRLRLILLSIGILPRLTRLPRRRCPLIVGRRRFGFRVALRRLLFRRCCSSGIGRRRRRGNCHIANFAHRQNLKSSA